MKIDNININYVQYGSGYDIVLLHGWGQNIQMMKPIGDRLCKHFRVTALYIAPVSILVKFISLAIFFVIVPFPLPAGPSTATTNPIISSIFTY